MSIKIGVTGGIGTGKSTVVSMISEMVDAEIFEADRVAKDIVSRHPIAISQISKIFGTKSYENGVYNSRYISNIVFTNQYLLRMLNQIVHPLVHQAFDEFVRTNPNHIILYEAALIFENQTQHLFDATILVTAPIETRINRVMTRDNITREQVLNRMKNQMPDDQKQKYTKYIIENIERSDTRIQLEKILKEIIEAN